MRRKLTPVRVTDDATIIGADGITRALLHIGGVALAALSTPDQDRHAALLALLAASLPHKARLSIYIENRPADAGATIQNLRAQLDPNPYTPQLGELGDRLLDRWHDRLTSPQARHVALLDYWVLVAPYPLQDGYPDQSEPARLKQAMDALTRQLVSMGLAPLAVAVDDARAFLARHLTRDGDTYTAPRGVEGMHSYTFPFGGKTTYTRTLYLVQPPVETSPAWLAPLVASDCPSTIVLHLTGLSRWWERKRQGARLRVMSATTTDRNDITTDIAAQDARTQATALHTQGYSIVRVGCYIRLEGDTQRQVEGRVTRVLQAMRDTMIAEPGYGHAHQEPLYRSTLPGYPDMARSTYRWDSPTVGNAWPFLAFNPGTRSAGVPLGVTDAAGDVVTLALDDPTLYNRIAIIVGRVGTGKTSLLQRLALWFLLRGDMATMVSSVDSFGALCDISGGERAVLGGADSACINVWDGPRATDADRRERVRFVTTAIDLLLGGLAGLEPAFLDEAVRAVYATAGETTPVMSNLYSYIQGQWTDTGVDADDRKTWRALGWRLRPYVLDGQQARLVDGQTSVRLDAPLLAFNTAPLDQDAALRNYAYFSVFAVVDARRALARTRSVAAGRASSDHLTGLDESWALLRSQQAREYINRTARTARHGGSCVAFASQQVNDLIGDSEASTFFAQASLKAIFSLQDSGTQTDNPALWLQRMLDMTPEEVERAQHMSGVKGEYMPMFMTRRDRTNPRDLHGIVRVELTPEEALLYASDVDDLAARDYWIARVGGDLWCGIKLAVDRDVTEVAS